MSYHEHPTPKSPQYHDSNPNHSLPNVNKPATVGECSFFFSSRRRHTRFDCDWSSDVCSSDLSGAIRHFTLAYTAFGVKCLIAPEVPNNAGSLAPITVSAPDGCVLNAKRPFPEIGRASCRERV